MKNSRWKEVDSLPDQYTQLRLFPPTNEEVLAARLNELEAKLDRQRKGQFGKIGAQEKRLRELEERFGWIEKSICQGQNSTEESHSENTCEILEMVLS